MYSGIKGVHWDKRHGKWKARITHNKQIVNLGTFLSKDDAAAAYAKAAKEFHGEFARS